MQDSCMSQDILMDTQKLDYLWKITKWQEYGLPEQITKYIFVTILAVL